MPAWAIIYCFVITAIILMEVYERLRAGYRINRDSYYTDRKLTPPVIKHPIFRTFLHLLFLSFFLFFFLFHYQVISVPLSNTVAIFMLSYILMFAIWDAKDIKVSLTDIELGVSEELNNQDNIKKIKDVGHWFNNLWDGLFRKFVHLLGLILFAPFIWIAYLTIKGLYLN